MSKKFWETLPQGSTVLEAGSSAKFKTGGWRSMKPIWIEENCIQCMFCWMYCPDMSVKVEIVKNKKGEDIAERREFDLDYGLWNMCPRMPRQKGQ